MNTEVLCAVLALIGSLGGSLFGILASNNKTLYRIEQLEKKVDKHNNVIERVFRLEQHDAVLDEEIKVANHRISDLEELNK